MAKKIAIIGGGAAGFFTAVNLAKKNEHCSITIYEASHKLLAKVLVSGGGRCNVTNSITEPSELAKNYPRGYQYLLKPFTQFGSKETQQWFENNGVKLKTEKDGRVFPITDDSRTIYNCFLDLCKEYNIDIETSKRLIDYNKIDDHYELEFKDGKTTCDFLVLATGSNQQLYKLISNKGIEVEPPIPSLFTLNAANHTLKELSGISVHNAKAWVKKGNEQQGPLLITHWGFSGPAILKLSAWEAITLFERDYNTALHICWNNDFKIEEARTLCKDRVHKQFKEKVRGYTGFNIPKRLWLMLMDEAKIGEYTNWAELGKKGIERMLKALFDYQISIKGKSTFKEEFVTAGGIDLDEVDLSTFELKQQTNVYAAGELLNIDAVTGGFNFQAAWTGAYLISMSIASKIDTY